MKILVIDNTGLILTCLAAVKADMVCRKDEIQALNTAEQLQPGLIFLHYAIRGGQTAAYIRSLIDVVPAASIVVIGGQTAEEDVLQCLLAGANGFQELQQLPKYSLRLVQAIGRGEAWMSRRMVARLLDTLRRLNQ